NDVLETQGGHTRAERSSQRWPTKDRSQCAVEIPRAGVVERVASAEGGQSIRRCAGHDSGRARALAATVVGPEAPADAGAPSARTEPPEPTRPTVPAGGRRPGRRALPASSPRPLTADREPARAAGREGRSPAFRQSSTRSRRVVR